MNKDKIMYALQQENIMRTFHDDLVSGIIGCMHQEYTQAYRFNSLTSYPTPSIFKVIVDMLVNSIMHFISKDMIEKIVDIIISQEALKKKDKNIGYSDEHYPNRI